MEQEFSEFRESDKSLKYDPGSVIASWSPIQEVVSSNPCTEMTNIFTARNEVGARLYFHRHL